jgi:Cu+-exporting ATPase
MTTSPASDPARAGVQTTTVELAVTGMHCGSCAALIEESLAGTPGVTRATVDLDSAVARVDFDTASVSVGELCAVVAGAGYGASVRGEPGPGT